MTSLRVRAVVLSVLLVASAAAVPLAASDGGPAAVAAGPAQVDAENASVEQLRTRLQAHDANLSQLQERLRSQNETVDALHVRQRDRDRLHDRIAQHLQTQNQTLAQLGNGTGAQQRNRHVEQLRQGLQAQNRSLDGLRENITAQLQSLEQLRTRLQAQSDLVNQSDSPFLAQTRSRVIAQVHTVRSLAAALEEQRRLVAQERKRVGARLTVLARYRQQTGQGDRWQSLVRAREQFESQQRGVARLGAGLHESATAVALLQTRVRQQNQTATRTRGVLQSVDDALADVDDASDAATVRDTLRTRANYLDRLRDRQRDQRQVTMELRDAVGQQDAFHQRLRSQIQAQIVTVRELRQAASVADRSHLSQRLLDQLPPQNDTLAQIGAQIRTQNQTMERFHAEIGDQEPLVDQGPIGQMAATQVREQRRLAAHLAAAMGTHERLRERAQSRLQQRTTVVEQYRTATTDARRQHLLDRIGEGVRDQQVTAAVLTSASESTTHLAVLTSRYIDGQRETESELEDLLRTYALALGDVAEDGDSGGGGIPGFGVGVALVALAVAAAALARRT